MALKRGGLRLLDTFNTFTASTRFPLDLEIPQRYIKALWVWLRGSFAISAVTVPGGVHADGGAEIVNQLELLVDGKTVKIGSGPSFVRMAQKYYQTMGVNTGLVSANAGTYPIEVMMPLMFESPSTVSPIDTLLDGRFISSMILNLTWGAAGDVLISETSTIAFTLTNCQVYVEDTEPFPASGKFWTNREVETTITGVLTSATTRFQLPFQPGVIVRGILLRSVDATPDDVQDDIINQITLRINGGEETPYNTLEDDFVQARSMHEFGIDSNPDGYYHLELAEGGRPATTGLGAKLEGQAVNSLDLILDTTAGTGDTSLVAHTAEMVPPEISGIGV